MLTSQCEKKYAGNIYTYMSSVTNIKYGPTLVRQVVDMLINAFGQLGRWIKLTAEGDIC